VIIIGRIIHVIILFFSLSGHALALENILTLDQLMEKVKQSASESNKIDEKRLALFIGKKTRQKKTLEESKKTLSNVKSLNKSLQNDYDKAEKRLADLAGSVDQRANSLGELFGIVRQVAGETSALFEHSIVSSQLKERLLNVRKIADSKTLPSISQLELLWIAMQQEMIESGKVVKYKDVVVKKDGSEREQNIIRFGVFNVISEGMYLRYDSSLQSLYEIMHQPPGDFLTMAAEFESSASHFTNMALDPSRGAVLTLYGLSPDFLERISQGKLVGYIIIVLGVIGLLLLTERFFVLSKTESLLVRQLHSDSVDTSNALGRILALYKNNISTELEVLERKIDEAIIKEAPALERGLSSIKILAVIAPLLGLLGTVTGMIETFQSITIFGTGDAKLMAGGISQALITTVLGLVVAIPLILFHNIVSTKSKRCINILEGQSAGLIAMYAESNGKY